MPEICRRQFLAASGALAAAAALPTPAAAMELELGGKNFHQLRTYQARMRSHFTCTLCPYYDGGFSYAENGRIQKTEGNPDHVASRGKFCAKGLASFLGAYDPDRILTPLKRVGPRGAGKWKEISWEDAIAEVAAKVGEALAEPDAIVVNEGGFTDGPAARFLDTVGSRSLLRSCTAGLGGGAKQSALKGMLGSAFILPDMEHSKYVLNFGCNILETALPLAQRLTDGVVNNRLKLVTFDVRLSNTAGRSNEWVPVFPGSDGVIALAMCRHILEKGLADNDFIATWTNTTAEKLLAELQPYTVESASAQSGVPAKTIQRLAVEFAKNHPATVISMNGVSRRKSGLEAERACLMLAVITGNIENEGGCCLPRQYDIGVPQPAPKRRDPTPPPLNHAFPFQVITGMRKVKVLINHRSNPVYSAPAASVWKDALKDEKLIPFLVDFTPFMSETAEFADLILPDVVGVERHDLVSSPTALWPWASISLPTVKPLGQARDVRETLKKIVESLDPEGQKGMKAFWAFANAKQWVEQACNATPGLEGHYKKLTVKGFWPDYGKVDPANRQVIKDGEPLVAPYGLHKAKGFATSTGKIQLTTPQLQANPRHENLKPGEFVLTTYKVAYHVLSMTSNLKYLSEIWHSNPLWINKESAKALGIRDGDLVRVSSPVGYLVTKVSATNAIHPQVAGLATSAGRTSYGRVAQADPELIAPYAQPLLVDEDIVDNVWWRDKGVNPNEIIPIAAVTQNGEQAWNDTVVSIAPAQSGDVHGAIHVDNAKHIAIFKQLMG
ncbi:MAG: molybdopterin-dependent oxidoreductase [Magnetococcales bacterium]|nr:molybdopterin-dependent oxidoreductase [Magnetococcales bacterium]